MFANIAGSYDLLNTLLSFGRDRAWRRFAASRCHLQPGAVVLDVATGTAELALQLARHHRDTRIVGLDFSAAMLSRARAKLFVASQGGNIELIMGDVRCLPFPDNTFDCATIGFALRNVISISDSFREMGRVVKSGGRVVSLELTRPSSRLVRLLYTPYLLWVAPFLGGLISGRTEAYTYLPESILEFPSPQKVRQIMEEAGLEGVETYRLALGAATVHVGTKVTIPT